MVGKLRLNEWTSKDGERRSGIQVVADAVDFLGAPTKKAIEPSNDGEQPADNPAVGATGARPAELSNNSS